MRPIANLNFETVCVDEASADPPGPLVWATGDEPWKLAYSVNDISAKPYIRTRVLVVSWRPWGVIVLHPAWPVMYAPDENSEFFAKAAFLFNKGTEEYNTSHARADLYAAAGLVMHKAIHEVAKQNPELLNPTMAAILSRFVVPMGTAECRLTEPTESSSSSGGPTTGGTTPKRARSRKE